MTWLLTRDDGRQFEFEDWRCAAAAHSALTGSRLVEKGKSMRCRAKMIDGSPVTFELTERWIRPDRKLGEPLCDAEASGEGFYVYVRYSMNWQKHVAVALERSGVDTATVEYLDTHHRPDENVLAWHWRPLFPPMLRALSSEAAATGRIVYIDSPKEPSPEMLKAGRESALQYIRVYSPCGTGFLTEIWRAMEKARTRQG